VNSNFQFEDLRSQALSAAFEIAEIAERFPESEQARRLFREFINRLKFIYVAGRHEKLMMTLGIVYLGRQKASELAEAMYLSRREIDSLLAELIELGFVQERRQAAAGEKGGRPSRLFTPTQTGETWLRKHTGDRFISHETKT
jgi:hypothetical protein